MANQDAQLLAFNRGVISSIGLARMDLERYAMSAEIQTNFIPRVLGSMQLRPGWKYIDQMAVNQGLNLVRQMPFIFEEDDTALLEFGVGSYLRVRINDVLLERPVVATAFTNASFTDPDETSPPTGWSIDDDANCTSYVLGNTLHLLGSGEGFARTFQTLTVAPGDQNVEHGLSIGVIHGPVRLRVGSTVQGSEYISDTLLQDGSHQLAFTPITGTVTIELSNDQPYNVKVGGVSIKTGVIEFGTPWSTEQQVRNVRWDQSGDRIYCASEGLAQKVIERRFDGRSWSIVEFVTDDGPFRTQNTGSTTIQTTAISGDYDPNKPGIPNDPTKYVRLISSDPIFSTPLQGSVFGPGALFRLASQGQTVTNTGAAVDVVTDPIRVVGSEDARSFGIIIEGTFVGTVSLQFAFDENGPWNDQGQTWSAPVSTNYKDGQDGQIIYYRLRIAAYTSGNITMTLNYTGGSIQGIGRVFEVLTPTEARIHVIKSFGSINPTKDWWEISWSGVRGYPNAVAIHEGRLGWAGEDRIWMSVSDDFESHDDNVEGDSGPINRTIGSGAIRVISWMLSMARLMFGTSENSANVAAKRMDGNNPLSARSTNFDEPLTPFNFNIKTAASRGVFVDRTKKRVYELVYDIDIQDFKPVDLSIFAPEFNVSEIVQIDVQMKPDVRVHCVRADGTVGMLVYDRAENVIAWVGIEIGGPPTWKIEDVAVLPGTDEDQVYYTVEGNNFEQGEERFLLKWSLESEARGGLNNYISDAWTQYDGAPTSLLTGLNWLSGLTVNVWADGAYVGDAVVTQFGTPGELDLSVFAGAPFSNVVVGLPYIAQFKSVKLGQIDGIGFLEHKRVNKIGFLAENLHYQGVKYGPTFDELYDLPRVEDGQITPVDTIWATYHEEKFPFGGEWDPDSRICMQAESPKPCTILAAIADFQSVEDPRRQ